jgi:hypothetical protein
MRTDRHNKINSKVVKQEDKQKEKTLKNLKEKNV